MSADFTPDVALQLIGKALRIMEPEIAWPSIDKTVDWHFCDADEFCFEMSDFTSAELLGPAFRAAHKYLTRCLTAAFEQSHLFETHELVGIKWGVAWCGEDFLKTNVPTGVSLRARLFAKPKEAK